MGLQFVPDDLDGGRHRTAEHAAPVSVHVLSGSAAQETELEGTLPGVLPDPAKPQPVLRLWHVVALIFFCVSGGPYSFEDVVGSAGGWMAFGACFVMPFFWSLPLGLMTAELSSLLPENGGFIIWVSKAFGPYTSWINSAFGMLNGCFDNSLYPIVFTDYINTLLETTDRGRMQPFVQTLVKVVVIIMVTVLNLFGIDAVGEATLVFGGLVMFPFIVLVFAGLPKVAKGFKETPPQPQQNVQLGRFLAVMAWNNCGWDSAGNCAAEIVEPAKTLPKAMLIAVGLITLNYVLPLLVSLPVLPDPDMWSDGTWVRVGYLIAGEWLSHWIALMAMVSALGMFSALLCTTSRLLYGVACNGQLPAPLAKLHPRFKTPANAIIVNAATTLLICTFPKIRFADVAQIAMMFYLSTTVLKFIALVRLRRILAESPRPFRIPMSDRALIAFVGPPCLTCLVAMFYMDWFAWIVFLIAFAICSLVYRQIADPNEPTSLYHGLLGTFPPGPKPTSVSPSKAAAPEIELAETARLLTGNGHGGAVGMSDGPEVANGNGLYTHTLSEGTPRVSQGGGLGPVAGTPSSAGAWGVVGDITPRPSRTNDISPSPIDEEETERLAAVLDQRGEVDRTVSSPSLLHAISEPNTAPRAPVMSILQQIGEGAGSGISTPKTFRGPGRGKKVFKAAQD